MKKIYLVVLLCLFVNSVALAETFHVVGTHFPPFMFEKNGKPKGIYVDILSLMVEKMPEIEIEYNFYPVPRMLLNLKNTKNSFSLGIHKNSDREDDFKWVGPVLHTKAAAYKLKRRSDLEFSNVFEPGARKIGVGRGYAISRFLKKIGIPDDNIEVATTDLQNIELLFSERIDFVATVDRVFWYSIQESGRNTEDIEYQKLGSRKVFFAFNKGTDDGTINKFQSILEDIKKTPQYKEILGRYIPTFSQ